MNGISRRRLPGLIGAIPLAVLLLVACGSRQPDLEAPNMSIIEIVLNENDGTARLRLDNPVRAPMPAVGVEFELLIQQRSLGRFSPRFELTVPPLGSETVSVQFDRDKPGAMVLTGGAPRVDYALRGSIRLEDGGTLEFDEEGWLTPTPGKPGSWR